MFGMNVERRLNMEYTDVDERVVKGCILGALKAMRLTVDDIEIESFEDDSKNVELIGVKPLTSK